MPKTERPTRAQAKDHPEWALAYILVDWRRRQAVRKAYNAVIAESPEAGALLKEALRKCRAYVTALEEVVNGD